MSNRPQRSALIVANGILPNEEIVRTEISNADFVLAADGGVDKLAAIGITPDAVLGDMDSLSVELSHAVQIIDARDQNMTDLEKSVRFLKDEGYESITIIGATGDRLDHTFGALAVVVKYNVRLVDDIGMAISVRGPGQIGLATRPGQTISLMPLGIVSGLTTRNLKWELHDAEFNFAQSDGTSNVATADYVEVFVRSGDVIVYAHHPGSATAP